MPLNIKDEQAHEMARELASLTGETMTKAVNIAIEERLAAVGNRNERAAASPTSQTALQIIIPACPFMMIALQTK